MPGNVTPAVPVGVMPFGLCSAFSEEMRIESIVNTYPDGSSDRAALSATPRRFFRMTRPVTSITYSVLRSFYLAHPADPFYFYNLRETVPPWTWDSTGNSPGGRYVVVFDGPWSDQVDMGRSSVSLSLREVQ